jgi:hypothetical protein
MPATDVTSTPAEPGADDTTHATCTVCPHAWDAHDRIGIRYCSATKSGLDRGCVCVVGTTTGTADGSGRAGK